MFEFFLNSLNDNLYQLRPTNSVPNENFIIFIQTLVESSSDSPTIVGGGLFCQVTV